MSETPETLYKYATADVARAILESRNLRWSSPELFGDPWEVSLDPKLGFDHLEINRAMLKTATSMIFTRDLPSGNPAHPLYKAIRRWRAEDRFHDEGEAYDALAELLAQTPDSLRGKLTRVETAWREIIMNARIACFSETGKDLSCWRRYGDDHRGAVLRFSTLEGGAVRKPQRVIYGRERPRMTTIREQVEDLVGIQQAAVIESMPDKLLQKSKLDESEREWRCMRIMAEQDLDCGEDVEDWYMDVPFDAPALRGVMLGYRMSEDDKAAIVRLVRRHYPGVPVFQAVQHTDLYEIDFERLGAGVQQSTQAAPAAAATS